MNFRHLRSSMILTTSLLILISSITFGIIIFNLNKVLVEDNIIAIHKEITNNVLIKLDSYLSIPPIINNLNDAFLRITPENPENTDILRKYFYRQLSIFKTVNLIAFGTEERAYMEAQRLDDGRIRTGIINNDNLELWTTDTNGQKTALEKLISNYDPRIRPWYIASKEAKKPRWSDIYLLSSNKEAAISANQPFFNKKGNIEGVITTSITLKEIGSFLSELSFDNNSSVLILEPSGLAIATSKNIPLLDSSNQRITSINLEDPVFSGVSKKFDQNIESSYTNTTSEFSILVKNTKYFVRSTPYYGPQDLRWNVLVIIPGNVYMTPFYKASALVLISLIVFILITLLLGYLITVQTSKPIMELSKIISSFSLDGNNITAMPLPVGIIGKNDEIGILARTFLEMGERLNMAFSHLRESQKEYKTLVENINSIIMRLRPDGTITYCNQFGLNFYGYTKEELIGSNVLDTVLNTNDPQDIGILDKIFSQDNRYWNGINKNITSGGKEVWILWANTLLFNNEGSLTELLSIGQDYTSMKTAQAELSASLREKNILLKEIHHRVKNNLQIITSLINLQLEDISNKIVKDSLESLQSRIYSMSLVHEMLYSTDSLEEIDFHDYLDQIISTISATFNDRENPIQISLEGDIFYLDIERSITCGLLVNEIIINSFKHAFIGRENSNNKIDLILKNSESGFVTILIRDNGVGIIKGNKSGIGTLLIDSLTDQIGGEIQVTNNKGTSICLTFKKYQ